jgi:hypothetical protein
MTETTIVALTKAEMAERLFDEMGLNKREAKELVEQFFEEVRKSLSVLAGIPKLERKFQSGQGGW